MYFFAYIIGCKIERIYNTLIGSFGHSAFHKRQSADFFAYSMKLGHLFALIRILFLKQNIGRP